MTSARPPSSAGAWLPHAAPSPPRVPRRAPVRRCRRCWSWSAALIHCWPRPSASSRPPGSSGRSAQRHRRAAEGLAAGGMVETGAGRLLPVARRGWCATPVVHTVGSTGRGTRHSSRPRRRRRSAFCRRWGMPQNPQADNREGDVNVCARVSAVNIIVWCV